MYVSQSLDGSDNSSCPKSCPNHVSDVWFETISVFSLIGSSKSEDCFLKVALVAEYQKSRCQNHNDFNLEEIRVNP